MQLHLVLPGLVWPSANARGFAAALGTPALEALLGHARIACSAATSFEAWLAALFGLHGDTLPHAALRRLGEHRAPHVEGEWLCADPVHLHFARERLLLSDASELDITEAEAAALVTGLNDFLVADEADFAAFEACAPTRWYLHLNAPARAQFVPLSDVVGRPVSHFLPAGEDGRRWQRIGNELQVFLHNHPVNQAREAAGRRTVNSVWFWGAGTLPGRLSAPADCIVADDILARGLARAAGIEPGTPTALPSHDALVVLDTLHRPSLYLDVEAWRSRLLELEARWFVPLVAALKARRISSVRISAPGDRHCVTLDVRAGDLWKFWRRPRSLEALLDTRS